MQTYVHPRVHTYFIGIQTRSTHGTHRSVHTALPSASDVREAWGEAWGFVGGVVERVEGSDATAAVMAALEQARAKGAVVRAGSYLPGCVWKGVAVHQLLAHAQLACVTKGWSMSNQALSYKALNL
jgi:hypothetical protein